MSKQQFSDPTKYRLMLVREGTAKKVRLISPADVSRYANELRLCPHEQFAVILLSSKNHALGLHVASMGTIDASLVSAANVFKAALLANAAAVILVHQHPSGDPTPSGEDLRVTRQLVEAGSILGIRVIDHVVLGADDKFESLRESGLVNFQAA